MVLTFLDIPPHDCDVVIPVGPGLFVIESHGMACEEIHNKHNHLFSQQAIVEPLYHVTKAGLK